MLQVAKAAMSNREIFFFDLSRRNTSAAALAALPAAAAAAEQLGLLHRGGLAHAVQAAHELVPLLSDFCLTPPGDTPTRRGFIESLLLGCVPVLFHELSRAAYPWCRPFVCAARFSFRRSRPVPGCALASVASCREMRACNSRLNGVWQHRYLSPEELEATTVLLHPERLGKRFERLVPALEGLEARLPAMRAAIARVATRLQWATADLTATEHAALGPDALDVALWHLSKGRSAAL